MRRLSVASIFLRSCYSISIRPDVGDDYDPDVGCRDAAPGEWCHAVVMWAKEIGFEQRPGWLPGGAVPHRARELQALLHRHGEAGCPRPCPQDRAGRTPALSLLQLQSSAAQAMSSMSAAAQAQTMSSMSSAAQAMGSMSSAAQAVSSRSRAAQTMRMSSKARSTLGLNHALFQAVMERSLQPKALRESEARKRGCQDAEPGGLCYQAASWLHDRGLESHPTWFPSLSPDSTMQEVQSVLYTLGKATCPRPCQSKIATRRAQSDDDRVLEVDDSGRQVLSEAYELSEPTDCGNTVEGDWCYVSIMWLKDTGLDKHSDWYPTLTHQSSMEAFQTVLHNQGKVGCPLPCSSNSTAPELNEALVPSDPGAAVSDSALRYEAESAECEDAEEGSQCHKAISRVMDVGLWLHPEEYPELAADCTRQEIQEHLYLRRKYGCVRHAPRPLPKEGAPSAIWRMSAEEPGTEFKRLLLKLEAEHTKEVDRLRAQIGRLQQENVRGLRQGCPQPRSASRPPLGPNGSVGLPSREGTDGSLTNESASAQSAPAKLQDIPPGRGSVGHSRRHAIAGSEAGSEASRLPESTPAKRQGPGLSAGPSREGTDGSLLPESAQSAPARLQKEFSGGLLSVTSRGSETPRRAESLPAPAQNWALSPRPLQRPPAPACPPIPLEELGLSRLSGGGHSPPHTVSTQAPRTGSTQLHTSSPRGPTFGPRVEGTLGQGMSQPSPSAAPKLDLDTGGRSQKPQSQRDEPREGNSTWNNMPTLAGLLSPRNTVKEVSMAERCSSHCKLEEGNRNEVTAEACSTQVGEDSCLKAHLLEAETGGFQGPAIAMMDRMGGEVENGHASLEAANMSKWKTLLDAVGERLDGGVVSQFTPSTMWVDALDKERPSGLPSGEEDAQIELGSVLRFLKKDWLLDGRRRSDSGAMTELLGGAKPTNRWTLYPNGRQRLIWDVLGCLLLLHDLIMIPMVVFDSRTTGMPAGYKNFETIFQFASASFWTLDIFVSFITGFHSSEGFVEMDPYKVARNYIKSWLCLDLVIVAVDWSSIFVSNLGDASDSLRLGKTASRIMRVFRLLRFAKMNTHMQDMMNMVNSEYIQQLMGLLKLLVAIVIVNHYVACFWFLVAATNPSGGVTWAMNAFGGGQWSMIYAYTTCLHWSLTQFTPASMEVVPENEVERTFNIVVIIMALVIFSSFVSSITSTMTHIRNINDYKTKQEAAVRGFFTEHQIPAKLVSRVWHFIKHHRRTVKKRTRLQDVQAFKGLPPSVKDEIRKAMFMPILKVHPVFLEYSRIDPPALHEMLKIGTSAEPPALNEQSIQSMGGVELDRGVGEGGLVKEIVFVVRGVLDYQQSSDGQATASVGEGQWCCEAALWIAEAVLEGSLLAADGGAEVVTVHSRRFQSVAKSNPTSMPFLARYAKLFTEKLNEAQMDPDYKCVLFNCQEEIQELVDDSLKVNMGNVSLMKRANATLRKSMSRPSQ